MAALWWAAGEEIEFPVKGAGVKADATFGWRRSSWTRCALSIPWQSVLNVGAEGFAMAAPVTNAWLSLEIYADIVSGAGTTDRAEVGLAPSGVGGIYLGKVHSVSSAKLGVFKVSSAGVVTRLAMESGTTYNSNVLHRVDMQIVGFNTATATIRVYLEGNPAFTLEWTGDLTGLGFTALDRFRAHSTQTQLGGTNLVISEIIIADEDTRTFAGVASLVPNAAGTTNTFTAGAYTDVDETTLNDADMLQSASVGQEFDCALSDIVAPGTYTVRGVKLCARASKGATGPGTLQLGVNSGGTRNTVDKPLVTALSSYERLMVTNPITGQQWTTAEVNALEACVKSAT